MYHNGVSNPDHTYVETITAPDGKAIDSVTIQPDGDIYIIDNVRVTTTSSDPALTTAAQEAAITLATEQSTLTTLQVTQTTANETLATAQTDLATAQSNEITAQGQKLR